MATISTINGVDIGNVAKINGIDIANISSVNGGDVVTADFVATIDATYVDSDLTNFPIGIQLNAVDGFSGYGATDWQYLHATVAGSECYVEVDVWDTTANIAVLWVKVPTVSSSSDTVILLNITAVKNDFITHSIPTVFDDFTGANGDEANPDLWDVLESGTSFNIQNNKLQASHTAIQATSRISRAVLSGDFDIEVDFEIVTGPDTNRWILQFVLTPDNPPTNTYILVDRRYDSGHKYYSNLYLSGVTNQNTAATTNTSGKFRVTRVGSVVNVYYYDSGWVLINNHNNYSTADMYIQPRSETTTVINYAGAFDNLTINSCDSITGFIGQTTDDAAKVVWDSDFAGVWHMSQDPSGGIDSILDSTANVNHGTPQGTMTSGDLVDEGFGKAIEFDGTNGVLVTSSESLKVSTNATVELYYKDRGTTTSYATQLYKRQSYLWTARSASALNAISNIYLSGAWRSIANYTISQDTWLHGAFTYNSTSELLAEYINGTLNQSAIQTGLGAITQTNYSLSIGFDNLNSWYSISSHSEIRISNIDRSAAWIKATAQNLLGNLVAIS